MGHFVLTISIDLTKSSELQVIDLVMLNFKLYSIHVRITTFEGGRLVVLLNVCNVWHNVLVGPLNVKTSTMSSITHLNSPTFHTEYTPENYSSYYLVQLVFWAKGSTSFITIHIYKSFTYIGKVPNKILQEKQISWEK